jgi:hypothetical protein
VELLLAGAAPCLGFREAFLSLSYKASTVNYTARAANLKVITKHKQTHKNDYR